MQMDRFIYFIYLFAILIITPCIPPAFHIPVARIIRENTYHFTNEWAGMPVKLGKLARYFGKLEFWHFYKYQYECIPHKYVLEFFGICFIAL